MILAPPEKRIILPKKQRGFIVPQPVGFFGYGAPPSTLLDGLISWWELDEASGTRVDVHGGLNLASTGVGSATGHVHALAANLVRAEADKLSRSAAPYAAATGTCAMWFRVSGNLASNQYIVMVGNDFAGEIAFALFSSALHWRVNNDASHSQTVALALNTWYFAIGDWEASTNSARLFFNNGSAIPATGNYTGVSGAGQFLCGWQHTSSASAFDGRLGPLAYWDRLLTSDERTELWNGGAGIAYPG